MSKKIFIGPNEIAGYYKNLSHGFKTLNVRHDLITYVQNPFGYGGETSSPQILKLSSYLMSININGNKFPYIQPCFAFIGKLLRYIWAFWAIIKYDVFIFGFGSSLLWKNFDLVLLKFLNKKVISNLAHGSESRPPVIDGFVQSSEPSNLSIEHIKDLSLISYRRVQKFQKGSALVVGAPFGSTQFCQNKMINSFIIGVPCAYDNIVLSNISKLTRHNPFSAVKILHSPSNNVAKGTRIIEESIYALKKKGYLIDFLLIHGRPHNEVLYAIQECDFVVDQLYSDTPMAGFAAEAAWFGKPAVVGGYGFEKLRKVVPEAMWPPSKTCHPDEIEQAIEDMIVNVDERQQLGAAAQKFVREKWNATEVARRYLRLIEGDIPEEWWLDPQDVIYVEGAGQSAERTKENIRQLVDKYGASSLQLSHRPELEKAFLEFAGVDKGR